MIQPTNKPTSSAMRNWYRLGIISGTQSNWRGSSRWEQWKTGQGWCRKLDPIDDQPVNDNNEVLVKIRKCLTQALKNWPKIKSGSWSKLSETMKHKKLYKGCQVLDPIDEEAVNENNEIPVKDHVGYLIQSIINQSKTTMNYSSR